jgi:mxaJ protein
MRASVCILVVVVAVPAAATQLRVCADPNNLPFSNQSRQGFENKIAEAIAQDMGATVQYTWWPNRRNYPRNTIEAKRCDVILGVPRDLPAALTTAPYYRSEFVAVYRKNSGLHIRSFDDPALAKLKIGVHVTDFDYMPPGIALVRRGIRNLVPFSLYGENEKPNPPSQIIDAVADGRIDVAFVWGPLAGYFARRAKTPLEIAPLPERDGVVPMAFAISAATRRNDAERNKQLQAALEHKRPEIEAILRQYGVPLAKGGH